MEYDLAMNFDVLVSRVNGRRPDVIIVINNNPSQFGVVKKIREQKLFDAIPLVVLPGFGKAISFIESIPPAFRRGC